MSIARFDAATDPVPDGTLLLEASAGTGKTYALTTLATRMIAEGRVESVDRLLMVTFTNAATHELRDRLRTRLREARGVLAGADPGKDDYLRSLARSRGDAKSADRIDAALRDFDDARVSTIHGFCARVLQETAFDAGLPLEAETQDDTSRLRTRAVSDAWREVVDGGPAWRAAWMAVAGPKHGRLERDFDLWTRMPGARHEPDVIALEELDAAVATWRAALDGDFHAALLAFLDSLGASAVKTGGPAARLDTLAARLRSGSLDDDLETWTEIVSLVPGQVETIVGKRALGPKKPAWVAIEPRLVDLERSLESATLSLRRTVLERAHVRFARMKREANVRDHDDLIAELHARIHDPDAGGAVLRALRARLDVGLIDEFQDTDQRQWEIFERVFAGKRLVLVGDPKQAIYSFRGADVFAYFRAKDAADDVRTLDRNWRSHPDLVDAINRLFVERPGAFAIDDLDPQPVRPAREAEDLSIVGPDGNALPATLRIEWIDGDALGADDDKRLSKNAYTTLACERVIAGIRELTAPGTRCGDEPLHPGRIAVLTWQHQDSRTLQRALRDAGIDAVVSNSGDVRGEEVFADLVRLLEAMLDSSDARVVRRALATSVCGLTVSELDALVDDDDALAAHAARFEEHALTWRRRGAFEALARAVAHDGVEARWLAENGGERKVTDLRHAMEWIHHVEVESASTGRRLVETLWSEASDCDADDETARLRLERDENAVQIVTVFASKGLEYDVVFVPFAWAAKRAHAPWVRHDPDTRDAIIDWATANEPDVPEVAAALSESLAEGLRLLYVALTRAKRRCVWIDTDHRDRTRCTFAPQFHLLHRPDDVDGVDRASSSRRAYLDGGGDGRADLDAVAAGAPIEVASVRPGVLPPDRERRDEAPSLDARPLPADVRVRLRPWRVTSFTALAHGAGPGRLDVLRDHDVLDRDDPDATVGPRREARGIFAFARGAHAGNCLHEILERSDFDAARDDPAHVARVGEILARHGLADAAAHAAPIDPAAEALDLVSRVGAEHYPGAEFEMASIDRSRRLSEWAFRLPVDEIVPARLAAAVERHDADVGPDLADRLHGLRRSHRDGLFAGVVDLVFEHEGRWHLIDWKSNHLGDMVDAYDRPSMHRSMLEHRYHLQLLLYQVALHRFLAVRLPEYDYDRHCGGGAYVFLRGLCGRADRGWITWRPSRDLVEAVDACFVEGRAR